MTFNSLFVLRHPVGNRLIGASMIALNLLEPFESVLIPITTERFRVTFTANVRLKFESFNNGRNSFYIPELISFLKAPDIEQLKKQDKFFVSRTDFTFHVNAMLHPSLIQNLREGGHDPSMTRRSSRAISPL